MSKNDKKLTNKELDNIAGGFLHEEYYSENPPHYLIVTWSNTCDNQFDNPNYPSVSGTCLKCTFRIREGFLTYCTKRSLDDDPYNKEIGTRHKAGPDSKYWHIYGHYYN